MLTLDFFTPVTDDPYEFGCVAAANALSDVFAMGGTVRAAMNILAFPRELGTEVVAEVLRGGASKVAEAGLRPTLKTSWEPRASTPSPCSSASTL